MVAADGSSKLLALGFVEYMCVYLGEAPGHLDENSTLLCPSHLSARQTKRVGFPLPQLRTTNPTIPLTLFGSFLTHSYSFLASPAKMFWPWLFLCITVPLARGLYLDSGRLDGQLRPSYDYIIVGGGASGLVVANRLTEDPNGRSLSLHAGYEARWTG